MFYVAIFVVLAAIVLVAVFYNDSDNTTATTTTDNNEAEMLQELRLNYDKALMGTNKRTALKAGRAYYAALRTEKVLTMLDELILSNDLSTMLPNAMDTHPLALNATLKQAL